MSTTKPSKILLYAIMAFGFITGYLYSTQSDPMAVVPVLDNRFLLTSLESLQGARIDQSVFSSEQYKALRVFGSLPVQAGGGGKDNPFQ